MQIETKRLILRPFTVEDAADVYSYSKDPRVGPPAGWQPHKSEAESREIIETVFNAPGVFAVEDRESGRVIGSVGFTGFHRKEIAGKDDQIGYSLAPAFWGRGLVPEAVEALLRYGFTELGLDVIWCEHYDGNIKSKRVIRKCGFAYQFLRVQTVPDFGDEHRLVLVYALKKREWEKQYGDPGN